MAKITLEKTTPSELDACYEILDEGREFQKKQGFLQWTESYPTKDNVREDIEVGIGYSVKVDGNVAGYLCLTEEEEPAYRNIKGAWHKEATYYVIHRWALGDKYRGIGLADKTLELVEEIALNDGIPYIRIDTDFENKRMQHILEKNGYRRCGEIVFQGSGKLAYDKIL